ncbi:coiled-coil domain-containing protein 112-like isoform X2 [Strongylocentrotus purpuratus]|uniref:CUE domain-containing protein n=1 Tax=Strongylocentrotus purpuratus TaxID=7668 RepID=A0A7M7NK07_STRPU|nr:coiled-coil domain-containing protein 112-like isoform X2 [Strongylocentrotus purpuratus]
MKALEDYRASKKPTTIRGEARCAGGSKSEEEARLDLDKQHRNKKYEQILKKEQRNREKREREDKEFQEKKAKARQTAEENARRRNAREVNFLRDEHATTNEKFLRRLDAGRTPPQSETSVSQSSKLQQLREMFPDKKPSKLQKLLDDNNNDVAEVADLLMD